MTITLKIQRCLHSAIGFCKKKMLRYRHSKKKSQMQPRNYIIIFKVKPYRFKNFNKYFVLNTINTFLIVNKSYIYLFLHFRILFCHNYIYVDTWSFRTWTFTDVYSELCHYFSDFLCVFIQHFSLLKFGKKIYRIFITHFKEFCLCALLFYNFRFSFYLLCHDFSFFIWLWADVFTSWTKSPLPVFFN